MRLVHPSPPVTYKRKAMYGRMRTQLHGSGSARLGWGGVGGRRWRSPGERRRRDLATIADRRECAEVSKARNNKQRSVSTHRDKQCSLWRRQELLSNKKTKGCANIKAEGFAYRPCCTIVLHIGCILLLFLFKGVCFICHRDTRVSSAYNAAAIHPLWPGGGQGRPRAAHVCR